MATEEATRLENPFSRVHSSRNPFLFRGDGGVVFQVNKVTPWNFHELRRRALPFEAIFEYDDPFIPYQKIINSVRRGGEVVFAQTPDGNDIGVTTQEVKRTKAGQVVLSVGIRAVLPDFQDRGFTTTIARESMMRHRPDVVTGQSRMWRIFNMLEDTGFILGISPFDRLPTPEMQASLIEVLDRKVLKATNLRTLVCIGVFPPAPVDRFIPPELNAGGWLYYNGMREIGAIPESGSGVRYYARVNQQAVEAASPYEYLMSGDMRDTRELELVDERRPLLEIVRGRIISAAQRFFPRH